PLSGFVGKLMLMHAFEADALAPAVWAALLLSGLVVALVLARAASALFWEPTPGDYAEQPPSSMKTPGLAGATGPVPLALLVAASPLLVAGAGAVAAYAGAAAEQLIARTAYIGAVLGDAAEIEAIDRSARR